MEKLGKINKDSNTRTFTIQEGESILVKCFTDIEVEDKNDIVWKRSDNKPLYNLRNTIEGNELSLTDSKCTDRGEYQCGHRSLNDQKWTNEDIGTIWHKVVINIICSNRTSIQVIPNTVIATETQSVDLSCPTLNRDTTVTWTKLSGENASPKIINAKILKIEKVKLNDAGLYQCSNSETRHEIYLQVNKLPVDGIVVVVGIPILLVLGLAER